MAENKKDEIQHEYRINAKEGLNTLSKLQIEYDELTKYIDKLGVKLQKQQILLDKAIPNSKREANLKKGIAEINKELDKSIPKQAQVTKLIAEQTTATDLTTLSKKQLNRQLSYLKDQYDRLNPAQADYIEQQKRIKEEAAAVNKELTARGPLLEKQTSFLQSLKGGLPAALIGGVAGGAVGVVGDMLANAMNSITGQFKRKAATDKSYGSLSAILGIDFDKDPQLLKFYKETVSDLGKEFKIAGNEIIKTIQIVGSLKPELLNQKEALRDVTADVIRLSRASGDVLSIADAAEAVTGALNQFGEESGQSTRFINVFAAGAKEGASEINQTAAAFKKSGAVLRTANLSFEESNALVQVLSTKMIRGEEAGTALRNIFSKLLTGSDELNPAIHGVNVVLERLAKLSPAEMMKLFGQETVVAAMELVNARGKVDSMTKAITGTNEALEQYRKQTDNLSGDLEELSATSDRFWTKLTSKSGGWMRSMVQGLTWIVDKLGDTFKYFDPNFAKMTANYTLDLAVNEMKKGDMERKKKAETDIRIKMDSAAEVEVGEARNKARRKVLNQELELSRMEFDAYNKVYNTNKKSDKDTAKNALEQRKIAGQKIIFAKQELERIEKNERENAELVKKIRSGVTDEEKKAGEKAAELERKRLENHAETIEKEINVSIAAIKDETKKKEAELLVQFDREQEIKRELVKNNEMTQADFNRWYVAAEIEVNDKIRQINKDALDKKLKEEKEAAEKVALMVLQTRLDNAQASGDEEQILLAKIAIEKQKFDIEIEKATTDMKQALYEQYLANIAKLHADHRKKEEDKEKAYGQKIFEILKKNAEKKKQAEDKEEDDKHQAYKKLAEAGEDFIFSVLSARLEKQSNAVDKQYDREQKALERNRDKGLLTEEDYTAQKTALEKQHQQKIAEIKRKQAIYDKAQALINIAINTAVAITKAAPNPLLMGLAAGAGLLQAGVVLAKPMPEYPSFDQGGDTNVFDRRLPANDGKRGFLSILHGNEYVIPEKVRNTRYWANIEPVIEAMRTNKMQSFDKGGSRTPMPSFSASASTAAPQQQQQMVVAFPPEVLNWFASVQAKVDSGINLSFQGTAELIEQIEKTKAAHQNSMISKTPNSL